MAREQLFLLNTQGTQLLLNLEHPRSVASATLRRGRTQPTPVTIKAGGRLELCSFFELSKAEVLQIVEKSEELSRLPPGVVRVFDPEAPKQRPHPSQIITPTREAEKEEQWRRARRKELEDEMKAAKQGKQKLGVKTSTPQFDEDDPSDDSSGPAPGEALEPGMVSQFSDSLPSTKWTKTQLVEYATAKGLDVEGLSKNAILRKLREV